VRIPRLTESFDHQRTRCVTVPLRRRAILLTEARDAASIRVLWSGVRGETIAAAAGIRCPRISTSGAARSAPSASTAGATGRLTAPSRDWSRCCSGDRGPEPATPPPPSFHSLSPQKHI
jgi:hypothetical protein